MPSVFTKTRLTPTAMFTERVRVERGEHPTQRRLFGNTRAAADPDDVALPRPSSSRTRLTATVLFCEKLQRRSPRLPVRRNILPELEAAAAAGQ